MHILHTFLSTFLKVLLRGISLTIQSFFSPNLDLILMTLMFDSGVILLREIRCLSLLGILRVSCYSLGFCRRFLTMSENKTRKHDCKPKVQ